jgi:hypothetical protein
MNRQRVLIVWTPRRVASTWLCNLLMDAIRKSGLSGELFYWGEVPNTFPSQDAVDAPDVMVVKAHAELSVEILQELGAFFDIKIFSLTRPGKHVAASWARVAHEDPNPVLREGAKIYEGLALAVEQGWPVTFLQESVARTGDQTQISKLLRFAGIEISVHESEVLFQQHTPAANAKLVKELAAQNGLEVFLQGHDSSTLWHANHFGDDSDADTHWYGDIRESVRVFDEAAAHTSTMARQTPRPPALRPDEFLHLYAHGKALSDHELATLRGQNQRQLDEMASLLSQSQRRLDEMSVLRALNAELVQELQVMRANRLWKLTKPLRMILSLLQRRLVVKSVQLEEPK